MKLKIFKEGQVDEKRIYLRLREVAWGVVVIACDEEGESYPSSSLLSITNKGKIALCGDISPTLGFDLDEFGRIKTDG